MGDRRQAYLHYDNVETPVVLYTHWGGSKLPKTIASALHRGRPRWNDETYLARIITSEMIFETGVLSETGMGIATFPMDTEHDDIHIFLGRNQVRIGTGTSTVRTFQEFIDHFYEEERT